MLDYPYILEKFITPASDAIIGTKINFYLKLIKKLNTLSSSELRNWQNKKLNNLVKYAYNNTTYYKNLFDTISLNPNQIRDISHLELIPRLGKEDIREHFNDIVSIKKDRLKYLNSSSGGSTGDPLKFLLDIDTWSFCAANFIINWSKTGYRYGDRYMSLGSYNLFSKNSQSIVNKIYYAIKGKKNFDGVLMPEKVCENYIDYINHNKINFVYGYASSIYLLANYAKKKSLNLKLRACFPTSEVLTNHYRKTIEEAFSCKVLNCYGAMDGGITSFEHNLGFHEVGYNSLVNLYDKKSTGIYSAQITDLLNYAMPLINYSVGDEYRVDQSLEGSNYNGQIINEIIGRSSEVIKLKNGNVLTGPGFTILFKDLPVEMYKIEIVSPGHIKCRIKPVEEYNDYHSDLILETLQSKAGNEIKVSLELVDSFSNLKSGKRDYFYAK